MDYFIKPHVSRREYLAGQALAGMLHSFDYVAKAAKQEQMPFADYAAGCACQMADALIARLDGGTQ